MNDRYIDETVEDLEAYIDRLTERVKSAEELARNMNRRNCGELADTIADIDRVCGRIRTVAAAWEAKTWEIINSGKVGA